MYQAGPANNEFLDKSGTAPDGIGTDLVGFARSMAADELGPQRVPAPLLQAAWTCDSGWSVVGGKIIAAAAPLNAGAYSNTANPNLDALSAGTLFEVTVVVESVGSGYFNLLCGGDSSASLAISAPGTYIRKAVYVSGASAYLQSKAFSGVISKVEVRTVRAAYQTTTAAKPKLVREPILGPELVVNGDGTNTTGWGAFNATMTASAGEFVATSTAVASEVNVSRYFPAVTGKSYRASVVARNTSTSTGPRLEVTRGSAGGWAGLLTTAYAGASTLLSGTFTASGDDCLVKVRATSTAVGQTFAADNISVREILGYTDRWSWEFDGVDDRLQFVPPSNIAAGCVVCCASTRLTAGQAWLVSMGATPNDQKFGLFQQNVGTPNQAILTTGAGVTSSVGGSGAEQAVGEVAVYTAWLDVAASRLRLRKNAQQTAELTVTGDLTTAFTVGRVGARFNDSAFANARIQAPVITSGVLTLAQIQQIEREVARQAGITLP